MYPNLKGAFLRCPIDDDMSYDGEHKTRFRNDFITLCKCCHFKDILRILTIIVSRLHFNDLKSELPTLEFLIEKLNVKI